MSDDIRMGIRQLIKNDIKSNLYIVQVTSVDTNENTCEGTTSLAESDIPLTNIMFLSLIKLTQKESSIWKQESNH